MKAQGKVFQKEGTACANGRREQGESRGSEGAQCDLSGQRGGVSWEVCVFTGVSFRDGEDPWAFRLSLGGLSRRTEVSSSTVLFLTPPTLCRHFLRRVSEWHLHISEVIKSQVFSP